MRAAFFRATRRLAWLLAALLLLAPAWAGQHDMTLRIGFPSSLFHRQFMLIADWRSYLESRLSRPVEIVFNNKTGNTIDRIYLERLHFAWVTDYSDTRLRRDARLLAVPLVKGQPYFTSYLIVPAHDDQTKSLLQLKGSIFALSDASHNGSYLEVHNQLLEAGQNPARFFKKIVFTGSNRDVIRAVALGLANGGEVDSNIWDELAKVRPDLAMQTRIIARSNPYGAAPIVASDFVNRHDFTALQRVLLDMANDPAGMTLLRRMGLDGFIIGDKKIYQQTVELSQLLQPR